jgi:hypothetical protein
LLRDDVFRDDVFFALARPPRAPAVRTDIVPRPLVVREEDALRVDDFFAVARPPLAPAFRFCAVVPARPPLAPAAFTDIVPRPLVFRAVVELVFRAVAFFREAAVAFLRGVVDAFLRGVVVFFRAAVDFAFDVVREAVLVFLREAVPPPREELELRDELGDEEDFVSPACDRCLLTVRAAISFARFVERPCFCSDSLTCSYCRSRFALQELGMMQTSSVVSWPANTCPRRALFMRACATNE